MPTGVPINKRALLAFSFSAVAGYGDVICFARYNAFSAMMTGNALQIGISMSRQGFTVPNGMWIPSPVFYFLLIVFYCVGYGLHCQMQKLRPQWAAYWMIVCVSIVITVEVLDYLTDEPFYPERWDACFLAPMFGAQSSVSITGAVGVPTTMVTGHLQSIINTTFGWGKDGKALCDDAFKLSLLVLTGLIMGTSLGVWVNRLADGKREAEVLLTPAAFVLSILVKLDDCLVKAAAARPYVVGREYEIVEIVYAV